MLHARKHTPSPVHPFARPLTNAQHASNYDRARAYTHTEKCVILIFHSNNGFVNAPHCYFTRTLPVLFTYEVTCFAFMTCRIVQKN